MLSWLMPLLPRNKPNHLLGTRTPESCASVYRWASIRWTRAIPRASLGTALWRRRKGMFGFRPQRRQNATRRLILRWVIPYTRACLHHLNPGRQALR